LNNTHANKAEYYDLGRPGYPAAFYDWLYGAFGLGRDAVIADIGAGTGKITKGFLERGNRVFAIEPDEDMRCILTGKLSLFENCAVLGNSAEDTEIPSDTIDLIFCGNAYDWFDRARVIPEFRRILKNSGGANVILATLGSIKNDGQLTKALARFEKPIEGKQQNWSMPFREGAFVTQEFIYALDQGWSAFSNGLLSTSFSPNPGDDCFDEYVQVLKQHFDRYSCKHKLKTEFKINCKIGNANDLI